MNWPAVTRECVATLSRMIQFDTTNPPGNETALLRWLQEVLERDGIGSVLLESAPGRGNLVARLPATRPTAREPLLLLCHVDVVPAAPAEWQRHPFSGDVSGGEVWGRGALDMKGLAAQWVTLVQQIKRTGLPTNRDIILAATADEEAGGDLGAGWLAEHHWDLVGCGAGLTEGGGDALELAGVRYFTVQVAEKSTCRFRLVARGPGGHGSIPLADNPVVHLCRAVTAVGRHQAPVTITPPFRAFVQGLAAHLPRGAAQEVLALLNPATTDAAIALLPVDGYQKAALRSMCRLSLCPTLLKAGSAINVVPAEAEAAVDCRILPGQTEADVSQAVESALAAAGLAGNVGVEFIRPRPPTPASPVGHPLMDSISRALGRHAPGAPVVPFMTTGATDSRYFRARGVPMYGFGPLLPRENLRTIHGRDERVSVESLTFGLQVLWDTIADYTTSR